MKLFQRKKETNQLENFIDVLIETKSKQLSTKAHAIEHAIDLISKTISKSEIQVYEKDEQGKIVPKKNNIYYALNVAPNDNELGTAFFYRVLSKYLHEEEALIVYFKNKLYLADSFTPSSNLLLSKTYSNVSISDSNGNTLTFKHIFSADEVIHLNLKSSKIKETLDDYYKDLGKLISITNQKYKIANSRKFRLKYPGTPMALKDPDTNTEISYSKYKTKLVNGLFDEEDSVIMLSEAFGLEKIDMGQVSSSEEWRNLEKKWSDTVAMSFNIPLDIFYGNKTDKSTSTNDFITFGVIPHLQILEDGLNAKIITKDKYLKGECIKINRLNMKHYDILESATSLDKLFADGFSHNELLSMMGMAPLDEDWANEHYITKNYSNVNVDEIDKGGDG